MDCTGSSIKDKPSVGSLLDTDCFLLQSGSAFQNITVANLRASLASTFVDNGDCTFTHTANNVSTVIDTKPTTTTQPDGTVVLDWCGVLAQQVVADNIYTADGTLTGNRFVSQNTNDINFDGRHVFGTSPYPIDSAILIRNGYDWGILIDSAFAGAAINANNTQPGAFAIRTANGDNFFNSASGNTLIGGLVDDTFMLNVAASSSHPNGITGSTTQPNSIAGYFRAHSMTGINRAGLFDAQLGAQNIAIQASFGDVILNTNDASYTAIGTATIDPTSQLLVMAKVGRDVAAFENSTGQENLRIEEFGGICMPNLPTTNPGGSGKLWNNGGVINIT